MTAKVDMMKMFGSAGNDGKMPLMITSQDDKTGWFGIRKYTTHLMIFMCRL